MPLDYLLPVMTSTHACKSHLLHPFPVLYPTDKGGTASGQASRLGNQRTTRQGPSLAQLCGFPWVYPQGTEMLGSSQPHTYQRVHTSTGNCSGMFWVKQSSHGRYSLGIFMGFKRPLFKEGCIRLTSRITESQLSFSRELALRLKSRLS